MMTTVDEDSWLVSVCLQGEVFPMPFQSAQRKVGDGRLGKAFAEFLRSKLTVENVQCLLLAGGQESKPEAIIPKTHCLV